MERGHSRTKARKLSGNQVPASCGVTNILLSNYNYAHTGSADDGSRLPPLEGDGTIDCDVLIVGGGYSGLSSAYFLSQLSPSLRIVLLEAKHCGYGASGRNRLTI